ncbi:MAG: hypothetical protein DRP83_06255 [Planctomycetota bacterium]|nr:MAG: hypothetical protein DRP83_06255 [Planctomycetota bacterium]
MKKHLKILMAGALVVVPLAATVWVIAWIGGMFSGMGYSLLETLGLAEKFNATYEPYAGVVGVLAVLVMVYLVGLLANFWMFRKVFGLVDRLLSSLPGIKTIYESIRDLLTLFGGDSKNMGHAVLYTPPGLGYKQLGILTNEHPAGLAEGDNRVIVYLPMGYMIGGPCVYARREDVERLDMSVETALKLSATAFISTKRTDAK